MQSDTKILIRSIVVVFGIIATVLSLVYGSYLPLRKSQHYINAFVALQSVKPLTVENFEKIFDKPLNYNSPIGQEEIVKFLGGTIQNLIGNKNSPEAASAELVHYIEFYSSDRNPFHLLNLAVMYRLLWDNYLNEEYYKASEDYYKKLIAIGPKLPPALYGLFDLYRSYGDERKLQIVSEAILTYWPDEIRVKTLYNASKVIIP